MLFSLHAAPREREREREREVELAFAGFVGPSEAFYAVSKNRKIEPAPVRALAHNLTVYNTCVMLLEIGLSMFSTMVCTTKCTMWGKAHPE